MRRLLKSIAENIPYCIGRQLARIPFSWRLGNEYAQVRRLCRAAEGWREDDCENYSINNFRNAFEYARWRFPCYQALYKASGVQNLEIRTLSDIRRVPTIDKAWVKEHASEFSGAYKLFSGGTTGVPTPFWMDKNCWAREWAHMHTIWERLGYKYTDLKATLRGKNMGVRPYEYNLVHNEFRLNTYLPLSVWKTELLKLFGKREIKYFHPFPSSMHEFLLDMERTCTEDEIRIILGNVKGLLLSSEFPAPYMIEKYKKFNLPFVSWYGHSEMCVLAYDDSGVDRDFANRYKPFVSYGLCEIENGHIIGTSFHNFDMPLIRYDTGDLVEATKRTAGGLCREFAIKEGRSGDYVIDKHGKQVSLTALIYGRHHKIFDFADNVQVGQPEPGRATIYVTIKDGISAERLSSCFDLSSVDLDFDFKLIDKPIRTGAGKLKLKV